MTRIDWFVGIWHGSILLSSHVVVSKPVTQDSADVAAIAPPGVSVANDQKPSSNSTSTSFSNLTDFDFGIRCFNEDDPRVNPTNLEACKLTQDLIITRDSHEGISPFEVQQWAYQPAPEGFHEVPDQWVALHHKKHRGDNPCRVVVSSGKPTDRDSFRLLDVGLGVGKILDQCLSASKGGWGGLTPIGANKGFFVAVDGYAPPRTATTRPSHAAATAMAVS